MKSKILFLMAIPILFKSLNAAALILGAFPGWDRLEGESPNIAVVACGHPLDARPNSDDDVVSCNYQAYFLTTLKGTNVVACRLLTNHSLLRGRKYLVFGHYGDGVFGAYEDFRVVPPEREF